MKAIATTVVLILSCLLASMGGAQAATDFVTPRPSAPAPKILGVSHIALKVSDINKSLAFYRDFLGYAEAGRLVTTTGSLVLVFVKVNDDQYFELFPGLKPEEDRLYQVAFQVEGIEALRARLAAQGIKVPARVPTGRVGNANFTVKDPDAHTLEFVQYEPAGWTRRDRGKFLPASRISTRIRHAGFVVSDAAASMKFYSDLLGFSETWSGSANDLEISWINMQLPEGHDYVELMLGRTDLPMNQRGVPNHISLEVLDIQKALDTLQVQPYWASYNRRVEIKTGKNFKRQLNLFDPDGTRVELMEPYTIDGLPAPSANAPLPK